MKNYSDTGVTENSEIKMTIIKYKTPSLKLTEVQIPIVKLKQRALLYSYFPFLKSQ